MSVADDRSNSATYSERNTLQAWLWQPRPCRYPRHFQVSSPETPRSLRQVSNHIRSGHGTELRIDPWLVELLVEADEGDVTVIKFYEALRVQHNLSSVVVDPTAISAAAANDDGSTSFRRRKIYKSLGQALAGMSYPCRVEMFMSAADDTDTFIVAGAIFGPFQQLKRLMVNYNRPKRRAAEESRFMTARLAGNAVIDSIEIGCTSRTATLTRFIQSLPNLRAVQELCIHASDAATPTAMVDADVAALELAISSQVLQRLELHKLTFSSQIAAARISKAVSRSRITELSINSIWQIAGRVFPLKVDFGVALSELNLRTLSFPCNASLLEFCNGMTGLVNIEVLTIQVERNTAPAFRDGTAADMFGRAVCRPRMKKFRFSFYTAHNSDMVAAIAANLQHSGPLRSVAFRRYMRYQNRHIALSDAARNSIFDGCSHCPNLAELCIPAAGGWDEHADLAAARCVMHCRQLVKLSINETFGLEQGRAPYISPHLRDAWRTDRLIQCIKLYPGKVWDRQLLFELAGLETENSEIRFYQRRFKSMNEDPHCGASVLGQALLKFRGKPHLFYFALTELVDDVARGD